jgi:hypothetical protein
MRRLLLPFVAGVLAASCSPQDEPLSPAFAGLWFPAHAGPCMANQGLSLNRGKITGPLGVTLFTVRKATVNGATAHLLLQPKGILDTIARFSEPLTKSVDLAELDISVTLHASTTQVSPSGVVMKHRQTGNFAGDSNTQRRIAEVLKLKRCTPSKGPAPPVEARLRRG